MSDAVSAVIVTDVVAVQEDDEGAPSRVNDYAVLSMLGEGSFSKVYHCKNGRGDEYALKILKKSFLKRKREYKKVEGKMVFCNALDKVQREVAIMKKLAHMNLVKLHEIIDSPADDKMFLVLELIQGGQVMNWDDKAFRYRAPDAPGGVLRKEDARNCMRDVVMALCYLHANHICHRDIKPENILLANSNVYKLADFGVAHMLDEENKTLLRSTEGTYHFLAPECTTGEEYDPFQVDIWALGVTLFAMLQGTLPFGTKAASLTQVMDSIREDPLVFGPEIESDCADVMRLMLEKDPHKRVRIQELKAHPWITEGSELARFSRSNSVVIEVTQQEIEAAFTPVNNFILMTKLKMKMSSRLARARKSVELRHDLDLAELRRSSLVDAPRLAVANAVSHIDTAAAGLGSTAECSTPRPPIDVATAPPSDAGTLHAPGAQAAFARVEVKRRNSSLLKSMSDELDSLVSASTPTRPVTNSEALAGISDLVPIAKSPQSSSSLSHRLSRRQSGNHPDVSAAEPRLPPLELSSSAPSSPAQSPAASPTNRARGVEALDASPQQHPGGSSYSPSRRPSPERRRSSNAEKSNTLPAPEPPVMLVHRKSGSLSPTNEDSYVQALADAKRKSSLAQRSHANSPGRTTDAKNEKAPSAEQSQSDSTAEPTSSWSSSASGSMPIPLLPAPRSPARLTLRTESLVINTTPEDTPREVPPSVHHMGRMSSIAKALGECIGAEQPAGTVASPPKSKGVNLVEIGDRSSLRGDDSVSEKSPKLFQKRNSHITAVSDPSDNSNAFSQAIIGGSSPPKRLDHPSLAPAASDAAAAAATAATQDSEEMHWGNPSFENLEHERVGAAGSPNKPRRSTFVRVFSKHKSVLEAQDSLQMLLRRKSSIKLAINDSRGSEAYESRIHDTDENTIANAAASANSPKKRLSARNGPAVAALVRASSQAGKEAAKPIGVLRSQKTVACSVM